MIDKRALTDTSAVLDLGNISDDGRQGKWLVQVTNLTGTGATITPTISADGTTFVGCAMAPVAGGALVANTTANGAWYIEGSGGKVRLTLSGTPALTATITAVPCLL